MRRQIQHSRKKITLAAGARIVLPLQGSHVLCERSTAPFKLSFDDDGWEVNFEEGFEVNPDLDFKTITIFNSSGVENNIDLAVGFGSITDKRFKVSGTIETLRKPAIRRTARPSVSIPPNSVLQVCAENLARNSVTLRNLSTAARVWVTDQLTTEPKGYPLEGLEVYSDECSAPVYVFNQSAETVFISVLEIGE